MPRTIIVLFLLVLRIMHAGVFVVVVGIHGSFLALGLAGTGFRFRLAAVLGFLVYLIFSGTIQPVLRRSIKINLGW